MWKSLFARNNKREGGTSAGVFDIHMYMYYKSYARSSGLSPEMSPRLFFFSKTSPGRRPFYASLGLDQRLYVGILWCCEPDRPWKNCLTERKIRRLFNDVEFGGMPLC